ncbi:MAG: zf-HC2 domain-containing protein [Thiohalomonadales bacterium]
MLNCKDVTNKANDYVDRDLSAYNRFKLAVHLLMCVHCRNYVCQLRTTIKTLRMRNDHEHETISNNEVSKIVEQIKQNQLKNK